MQTTKEPHYPNIQYCPSSASGAKHAALICMATETGAMAFSENFVNSARLCASASHANVACPLVVIQVAGHGHEAQDNHGEGVPRLVLVSV
jgi:hypothetical protein